MSTHPQVFRMPWSVSEGWSFVEALFASPGLRVLTATPRHAEIAAQTVVEMPHLHGKLLHDAHTAILMREHGIRRIYTRDGDFHKFAFLKVIDPMVPGH